MIHKVFECTYIYPPWNKQFAPENRPSSKGNFIFQPSIFRCKMLVSGNIYIYIPMKCIKHVYQCNFSIFTVYTARKIIFKSAFKWGYVSSLGDIYDPGLASPPPPPPNVMYPSWPPSPPPPCGCGLWLFLWVGNVALVLALPHNDRCGVIRGSQRRGTWMGQTKWSS